MKRIQVYKLALLYFALFFLLQSCVEESVPQLSNSLEKPKDSIVSWIKHSKNKSYSLEKQKEFLTKAYNLENSKGENESKAKTLGSIAYRFYELKDTLLFKKINKETLKLAIQLKDSFVIA
ncbi:MAG: hypothetical protein JKY02_04425, partial [Flavobacteriaceae bacterium]|nr:hypothetical protein [Flavobacteriaceae bacterium]